MIKYIKWLFTRSKIKKEPLKFWTLKWLNNALVENSDIYNNMTDANIQNILKIIKNKSVKNIEYENKNFFDTILYKIINLKYITNLGWWKTTFSYLSHLLDFEKIKKTYMTKLLVWVSIFLFVFFWFWFWKLYISYLNYSNKQINKIKMKYHNPYTLQFEIEMLQNQYKKKRIDKQTIYLIYYILLVFMLYSLILWKVRENKIKWSKSYQNFIIIYLIMLDLLNKLEETKKWKDIPYFDLKSTTYLVIDNLKNDNLIDLDLYKKIVSLLTNDLKVKIKGIDPSLYTFLKSVNWIQKKWEKNGFNWSLVQIQNIYDTVKTELLLKWNSNQGTYQILVLMGTFSIQWLLFSLFLAYSMSPVWLQM